MYTEQSDTPEKALKRYLATFEHVHSWFTGNVWDAEGKSPAHVSVKRVRGMHNKVRIIRELRIYGALKGTGNVWGSEGSWECMGL